MPTTLPHSFFANNLANEQALMLGMLAADVRIYVQLGDNAIGHGLHSLRPEIGQPLKVVTAENPVSAVGLAIGSAFAGVRTVVSVCAGQTPEILACLTAAEVAENPLVVVVHQGNLDDQRFVANLCQVCPVVLAAGSSVEAFELIQEACNLADEYQLPVILLVGSSASAGESTNTLRIVAKQRGQLLTAKRAAASTDYARYSYTKSGISPRKIPGQAGQPSRVNMRTHDVSGLPSRNPEDGDRQIQKRQLKLQALGTELLPLKLHGPADSPLVIVCYGPAAALARQALSQLQQDDIPIHIVQLVCLSPVPIAQLSLLIRSAQISAVLDIAAHSALADIISCQTGHRLPVVWPVLDKTNNPAAVTAELIREKFARRKV